MHLGVPYVLLTKEKYERVKAEWQRLRQESKPWKNRYMFNNVLRDFKKRCKKAGIKPVHKLTTRAWLIFEQIPAWTWMIPFILVCLLLCPFIDKTFRYTLRNFLKSLIVEIRKEQHAAKLVTECLSAIKKTDSELDSMS